MLATLAHLPKWLLAAVVFCVILGHCQQVKCKLFGCEAEAVHHEAASSKALPASPEPADHCSCQCHFGASTLFEFPPTFTAFCQARTVKLVERVKRAPEAPCAEIDYPPLASCA